MSPGSIASLERLTVGESQQWMLLRGRNVDSPVLLFLTGGLDGLDIATVRRLLGGLEDQFTVVTWDQRGSGKSLNAGFPRDTMTVRQLTSDALELVALLRARFHQRKIFLVGHSLGTVIAIRMAQERPEWFRAFVSVEQMVNPAAHDQEVWTTVVDAATASGASRVAKRLRHFGPPPYTGRDRILRYAALARAGARYLGEDLGFPHVHRPRSSRPSEVTVLDRVRSRLGLFRTFQIIYPRLQKLNLTTQAHRLDVPTYLVTGRAAGATPSLVERYFAALEAPHKELVRFERTGMAPCFDDAERFTRWLAETMLVNSPAPTETKSPGKPALHD